MFFVFIFGIIRIRIRCYSNNLSIRIQIRSKVTLRIIFVFVFGPENTIRSPLMYQQHHKHLHCNELVTPLLVQCNEMHRNAPAPATPQTLNQQQLRFNE